MSFSLQRGKVLLLVSMPHTGTDIPPELHGDYTERALGVEDTDWPQILRLYDVLERLQPSPVVSLNRAVAVAMVEGPRAALAIVDTLAEVLAEYHLLHSARADFLRRLGDLDAAAGAYRRALALASNDSERRFLERRLATLVS